MHPNEEAILRRHYKSMMDTVLPQLKDTVRRKLWKKSSENTCELTCVVCGDTFTHSLGPLTAPPDDPNREENQELYDEYYHFHIHLLYCYQECWDDDKDARNSLKYINELQVALADRFDELCFHTVIANCPPVQRPVPYIDMHYGVHWN